MDLKITNCNNFFKIKGVLNRKNVGLFNNVFENVFERVNSLTISIEEIENMDRYGVSALTELHKQSLAMNKSMAIIGNGSKDLYDYFKSQVAA